MQCTLQWRWLTTTISFLFLCFHSLCAQALFEDSEPDFLPAEEAFQSSFTVSNNAIHLNWQIADGYYLYKKRFDFTSDTLGVSLGEAQYSRAGKIKKDETFGTVEVFYNEIDITIPIINAPSAFELTVKNQGCAEAGLCYPPKRTIEKISLPQAINSVSVLPTPEPLPSEPSVDSANAPKLDKKNASSLASFIKNSGLLTIVGAFFLLGIGLTFTPCVLPMIPILSGIIAGQQQPITAYKGFLMSSAYVLGMALTFAIAGVIVGESGARIQIYMQHPGVLAVFSGIFVLLALAMFGFYELQLPAFLRNRLHSINQKQEGGNLIGVFLMGVLSALVVSPCVSAPLAGALLYIAKEGDAITGGLALLALGLGMGAPLIVIGTSGANIMPKAGGWMDVVKCIFGILMLAIAAWLIRSVLPPILMMWVWAGLLIIPAIYMGALSSPVSNWSMLWKGCGIMLLTFGLAILIGSTIGNTNPLKPLSLPSFNKPFNSSSGNSATHLPFKTVTTVSGLNKELEAAKATNTPVMVDYYADWCIACIEMEHGAFIDPDVIQTLSNFSVIQVDLTNNDATDALLDTYQLIGPPSILFFNGQGSHLEEASVMGELSAEGFLQHLQERVIPRL